MIWILLFALCLVHTLLPLHPQTLSLSYEPFELRLHGSLEKGYFTTKMYVGRNKQTHGPLMTFDLLVVSDPLSLHSTGSGNVGYTHSLHPLRELQGTYPVSSSPKSGAGYDPELSDTETLISCSADYCDKSTSESLSS